MKNPNLISKEDLEKLTTAMKPFVEIIAQNHATAQAEYMAGNLAKGATIYIRQKESLFHKILNWDIKVPVILTSEKNDEITGLTPLQKLLTLLSAITIDIKSGIEDISNPEEYKKAQENFNNLLKLFEEQGFTEKHPLFGTPMRPE